MAPTRFTSGALITRNNFAMHSTEGSRDPAPVAGPHDTALRAARDSLRNVVSIRDFLLAVQVGSETAVAMLDKVENKILEVLETLNEDFER
jgi:hypothetical protein